MSEWIDTEDGYPYTLTFPGDIEEPGHRVTPDEVQNHYLAAADSTAGITTQYYNFQSNYGFDPLGNPLLNQITPVQKQRAREVFEVYGEFLGVQFVETASLGFTIVTGDLRAIDPAVATGPGGVIGIAGYTLTPDGFVFLATVAIMDRQDFSATGDDEFGDDWYQTAMHEIGHLLGLGHTYELPPPTNMGEQPLLIYDNDLEPIYPGDNDIVHGQYLYRPESKDIDLYQFQVQTSGVFSAETIAERQPNTSMLDTVVTLYREVTGAGGSVSRELVARNDDYYSNDSYLEVELGPGTYYVGVSASGNDQYDPEIEDSGIGGVTQGAYELRLDFQPSNFSSIVNQTGQRLDGDADGVAGGVHNFWFRAVANTIFVDKSHSPVAGPTLGSLANPYNNIALALAAAKSGDVVRIVGNGGADGQLSTVDDNLAYEIGFSRLGGVALADGSTMAIPKGVTVMVDAGAVFKLRRARIGVGSSSVTIDRSAAALQVLGVPRYFNAGGGVIVNERGEVVPGQRLFHLDSRPGDRR